MNQNLYIDCYIIGDRGLLYFINVGYGKLLIYRKNYSSTLMGKDKAKWPDNMLNERLACYGAWKIIKSIHIDE